LGKGSEYQENSGKIPKMGGIREWIRKSGESR